MAVEIAEPTQRAVILWNGKRELLLLATEVALTSGRGRSAVEFIPLPSRPSMIRAESVESLDRVMAWANAQGINASGFAGSLPGGSLRGNPFSVTIGEPHQLVEQLTHVCGFAPRFGSRVGEIAERYLHRGIAWFAIDQIDIDTTPRSFPPVSYMFASDRLYYPLETSMMAVGNTHIELILITPSGVSDLGSEDHPIEAGPVTLVDSASLGEIDAEWRGLFAQDTVAAQHVVIDGTLRDLRFDLLSR